MPAADPPSGNESPKAPRPEDKSPGDTSPPPGAKPPASGEPSKPGKPSDANGPAKPGDKAKPGDGPGDAPAAKPGPNEGGADGEHGRKKVPRGYRALGRAFSRELPFAVSRDPIWEQLPLGKVGSVTVEAVIGKDGRIDKLVARGGAPKVLSRAVKRTRPALGGRFCLSAGEVAGREVLRIDVRLEQREPPAKQKIHYDVSRRPTRKRPGRVFFITERGRYFEATVTIVSSTPG